MRRLGSTNRFSLSVFHLFLLSSIALAPILRAEVILLPIGGTQTPLEGASGSRWVAQQFVRNTGSDPVNYISPNCNTAFCGLSWPPGLTGGLPLGEPFGFFLVEGSAEQVRFSTVVRDLNRQSESFGAEIPTVRESDLKLGRVELIRVPTDLQFRRNLRVYTVRTTELVNDVSVVRVRIYDVSEDFFQRERLLGEREFTLDSRNGPEPNYVGYLSVTNVDEMFGNSRADAVRVVIEQLSGTGKLWAFITLTNNATSHVTTVTP